MVEQTPELFISRGNISNRNVEKIFKIGNAVLEVSSDMESSVLAANFTLSNNLLRKEKCYTTKNMRKLILTAKYPGI